MFTKISDYIIATLILAGVGAFTWMTHTPRIIPTQAATPPPAIKSPTTPPKEKVADVPVPQKEKTPPVMAKEEPDASRSYRGGGSPPPPASSPNLTAPKPATPNREVRQEAPAMAKSLPEPASADQVQPAAPPAISPENRAPGAKVDDGIAAPTYSVTNITPILPELLATKNALIAVVTAEDEIYYSQDWKNLRFRLAATPSHLSGFNITRFIPYSSPRVLSACAEDFPLIRHSTSEIRIYLSHSLDSQILHSQKAKAQEMNLPLQQLANTAGMIAKLGDRYRFSIDNATARTRP